MTQEQITEFENLRGIVTQGRRDVAAKKRTLKAAEEGLQRLNATITKLENELDQAGHDSKITILNNNIDTANANEAEFQQKETLLNNALNDLLSQKSQVETDVTIEKSVLASKEEELIAIETEAPSASRDSQIILVKEEIAVIKGRINEFEITKRGLVQREKIIRNELALVMQKLASLTSALAKFQTEKNRLAEIRAERMAVLDSLKIDKPIKENEIQIIKGDLILVKGKLAADQDRFIKITDPRILVNRLNDNTPFLLLPVRLETRFMTIKHVKRVDDFKELPIEKKEALSWEEQITSKYDFGATNLIEKETVENKNAIPILKVDDPRQTPDTRELWLRVFPDDVALHTHEERLTADEFEAGKSYWAEFWKLDPNNPDLENMHLGAWRVLSASYGPERSAWIVKETKPTNLDSATNVEFLDFPSLVTKPSAWNQSAESRVMPDKFVVRVYPKGGGNYREVVGERVPDPLPVGFDPSSGTLDDEFNQFDTEIAFPEDIKWLTDFKEAEKIGMGIRIPLVGTEVEKGFEKILVLGLKLSADKAESKALLEELIDNHHYTSGGFSLVQQGTPTNNTEDAESGYQSREIGEEGSFAVEVQSPLFQPVADRMQKTDGQWFSEMIGVSEETLQHIANSDKFDQQEGMAMNQAVWPATMGYFIKQMLTPLVFSQAHNDVRKFHCEHIIARGRIPSFRVGNQPYGVIVTSAFSKWKFPTTGVNKVPVTLRNMYEKVLLPMNTDFQNNIVNVIHAGSNGDKQDNFLKILGLHASSVEYHQRFGGGQYFSWNLLKYFKNAPTPGSGIEILEMNNSIPDTLRNLYATSAGFNIPINPRILQMLFVANQRLLNGPVIDLEVRPYSETRGIQEFPQTTMNYIEWMLASDFNRVRAENFSNIPGVQSGQKPPKALLYLLLRHGCLLEYVNTATQILLDRNVVEEEAQIEFELQKAINDFTLSTEEKTLVKNLVTAEVTLDFEIKLEKQIEQQEAKGIVQKSTRESTKEKIRLQEAKNIEKIITKEVQKRIASYAVETTKWDYVTKKYSNVTGTKTMLEYILDQLEIGGKHTEYLAKIKAALEILKDMPTARLERCLAESLDVCNYRLDAWLIGLVNQRAEQQMLEQRGNGTSGTFLGAFGMLENLEPNDGFPGIYVQELPTTAKADSPKYVYMGKDPLTVLEYDKERKKIVSPPRINAKNLGFIHGPSMNHAIAAAILRAGYGGHEGTASPNDALAVNLRSDRVRKALFYIEGIRNGQDLASLLGYQFERSMHDLNQGLDQFILDIRRQFPLVANGVVDYSVNPGDSDYEASVEAFEARNVVDGLKLIEAYRENPSTWQSLAGLNLGASLSDINTIIVEVTNHMDALGDLMMAESMYQVATGNHERAGAVIKALGEGNMIPDPQIIKTPRLDKVYMQRQSILFDTATDDENTAVGNSTAWAGPETPRSYSEPALNSWIASVLPDPNDVIINYTHSGNISAQMPLSALGLQPIDLVSMLTDQGGEDDGTQLSALINYVAISSISLTEIPVSIKFIERPSMPTMLSNQITIFELLPLVRSIQEIIGQGRAAKAEDFLIEGEVFNVVQNASPGEGMILTNLESRLKDAIGEGTITPGRIGLKQVKENLEAAKNDVDAIVLSAFDDELAPEFAPAESAMLELRNALRAAMNFATQGAIPEVAYENSIAARDILSLQAARIISQLTKLKDAADAAYTELTLLIEPEDQLEKLQEIAKILFGRGFKVFPEFNFFNKSDIDLSRANNMALLSEAGDFPVDEWLHGISKVRPKMSNYHLCAMITESLSDENAIREVIQLPIVSNADDRWLSAKLPDGYVTPDQAITLVIETPETYSTGNLQSGLIIDEWTESIPEPNAVTGLSFNYDQPNSEAPNALLLAVTPEETGSWSWTDLMDILDETFSMAKKRAIDPDLINKHSALGHALPAIIASVEAADSAPGLDFSRNIIAAPSGQVGPIDLQQYIQLNPTE